MLVIQLHRIILPNASQLETNSRPTLPLNSKFSHNYAYLSNVLHETRGR